MFSRDQALDIARSVEATATGDRTRELEHGWYFRLDTDAIGSNGLIVSKRTGRVKRLGSAFSIERDLELYDKGYQFDRYDLVVTAVRDLDATLATFEKLALSIIEPKYEHGSVWRIPRVMRQDELNAKLATLPCVFGDVQLYFVAEHLEAARAGGEFTFVLLEYRPPKL